MLFWNCREIQKRSSTQLCFASWIFAPSHHWTVLSNFPSFLAKFVTAPFHRFHLLSFESKSTLLECLNLRASCDSASLMPYFAIRILHCKYYKYHPPDCSYPVSNTIHLPHPCTIHSCGWSNSMHDAPPVAAAGQSRWHGRYFFESANKTTLSF